MSFEVDRLRSAWGEFEHPKEVGRHEIAVFDLLTNLVTARAAVLEIGIGNGRATRILSNVHPDARYFGIDITDALRSAGANCVYGDARQLPFGDETFDVVFSLGVVEHFPQTALAIAEHARVTRPGGYVVMTTPRLSIATAERWLGYLRRGRYRQGSFEVVLGRNLRTKELRGHLRAAGLEDVRVASCGSVDTPRLMVRAAKVILPPATWHPYLYGVGRKALREPS